MPPSPHDAIELIIETTEKMRALNEKLLDQLDAQRRESAEFAEELAEERRRGDHGGTWQTLQHRIDLSQTTEQDVYSGVDQSAEAREVREVLKQNLTRLRAQIESLREEDEDVAAATADAAEARRRVRALQERGVFGE